MKRISFLLSLCLVCIGLAAQSLPFEVAQQNTDGSWPDGTHWYFISNGKGHYLNGTHKHGETEDLTLNNSPRPTDDNGVWCIVGNETDGYSFYNKATGKYLGMTPGAAGAACHAQLVDENTTGFDTKFDFTISNAGDGYRYVCFKQHNAEGDYYANEHGGVDGRLSYWNSRDNLTDNGSAFKFEEVYVENSWIIDRSLWTVTAQSEMGEGQEGGAHSGHAGAMIDGNDGTYWHSSYAGDAPGRDLPQAFKIDLGREEEIAGFAYLPRPNNANGTCTAYRMYVITKDQYDNENFTALSENDKGDPFLKGTFTYNGSNRVMQVATNNSETASGRYILFISDGATADEYFTCAEFYLLTEKARGKSGQQVWTNANATNANSLYAEGLNNMDYHDGMPGYGNLTPLKDAINAAYTAAKLEPAPDETALANARTALQTAITTAQNSAAAYPTDDVCFALINSDNRGTIIYDPAKDATEKDAENGNAIYLQEGKNVDLTNANNLWSFYYNTDLDEYYLYNVGKQQFANLGKGTKVGDYYYDEAWIFSDTPRAINMELLDNYNIHITGAGNKTMSISTNYTGPIITYYAAGDGGVPFEFFKGTPSEEAQTAAKTEIARLVGLYNNTEVPTRTIAAARAALEKRGVGYPMVESPARGTLQTAISNNTTYAQMEDLKTAINTYKATTADIQMPEDGKAYTITVADNQGNRRCYMNYTLAQTRDQTTGQITNNYSYELVATTAQDNSGYPETAKLICRKVGDKYVFVNTAGKYFIWKGDTGHSDPGDNSGKGYRDTYDSEWCDLTVEKLIAGDHVDLAQADLFGYMAIKGKRSESYNSNFIIKVNENKYDQTQSAIQYLTSTLSSALLIEKVDYNPTLADAAGIEGIEGIATFSAPFPTIVPEGVKAYYVTSADATKAIATTAPLAEAGEAIPASTGVLLTGSQGEVTMKPATTETPVTLQGTNLLVATSTAENFAAETVDIPVEEGNTAYILSRSQSGEKVAFFKLSSTLSERAIKKNKAYLLLSATASGQQQVIRMRFGDDDDDVTGIDGLTTPAADHQSPVYDLTGRRVMQTVKGGIYIKDGKKFIVK